MPFTSFAVAGAIGGHTPMSASLGYIIAKELLKTGSKVIVLARASSADKPSARELAALGAIIQTIDYSDQADVVRALKRTEVVVSAVGLAGIGMQTALADAAKAAGVKLFAPSEFGFDSTIATPDTPLWDKRQVIEHLKTIGLPYTLFMTGAFVEFLPAFFRPTEANEMEVIGTGETVNCSTRLADIGRYVAHVFTYAPDSALFNKALFLAGTHVTLLPLVQKAVAALPGCKVVHVDPAVAYQRWSEKHDFLAWLLTELEAGKANWKEEDLAYSRSLFPHWNPQGLH